MTTFLNKCALVYNNITVIVSTVTSQLSDGIFKLFEMKPRYRDKMDGRVVITVELSWSPVDPISHWIFKSMKLYISILNYFISESKIFVCNKVCVCLGVFPLFGI